VRSSAEQLALVRGWDDTRATLRRWQRRPAAAVAPWALASLAVAVALLAATWVVAILAVPDPGFFALRNADPWGDYAFILYRNGLVLALHAMACVAGFMAGSTLPVAAAGYKGWWRKVHDHAGRLAIAFVCGATLFSLGTQAWALGVGVGESAAEREMSPALFMLGLLPHAVPELCALFLPLAAWILASRRGEWHQLLAATFFTSALAVPILIACAGWEVWVAPHLLHFLK
jgi:hypothetical protein